MPLPTMSEFLEGLYNSRLLDHSQIEQLLLQPAPQQGDLSGTLRFLQSQGWTTEFQLEEILSGRGGFLFFAGYRLLDRIEETPAGTRYKAYHPALQKPVSLTMLKPEWMLPTDSLEAFLDRLQKVSTLSHPNLINVLDAGTLQGIPFVLEELYDGTDLGYFVGDMGAMPAQLGSDFIRQVCLGLQAVHDLGLCHGDLHPGQLVLTPISRIKLPNDQVSIRPGPGASIRVRGTAFTPVRPPLDELSLKQSPLLKTVDYMPPERLTQSEPTKTGDLYSLGACFYFLLVGRAPHQSQTAAEAIWNLQYGKITPVRELRSDVPGTIATLIGRMLSRSPSERPSSVFEVLTQMQSSVWDIPLGPRVEQTVAIPQATETGSFPSSLKDVMQEHNQAPSPFPVAFAAPIASFPSQAPPQESTPPPRPMVEPMDSSHRLGEPWQPRPLPEYTPAYPTSEEEPHDIFADHSSGDEEDSAPVSRRSKAKAQVGWLGIGLWGWIIIGLLMHLFAAWLYGKYIGGWF